MSFGNTFENLILDALVGSTQLTGVNTLWLGLSTADPGEDASTLAEPSGNGYARAATVNSTNWWAAAASGVKRNAQQIAFPTATGSWGLVTHAVLWRDATSNGVGSYVGRASLGLSKNVTNGDVPTIGVGSISITLD